MKKYIASIAGLLMIGTLLIGVFMETSGQAQAQQVHIAVPDRTFSVLRAPSISVPFINHVLCFAHSPACGTGQALYTYGREYRIDPAYALAFFQHESTYGRYGVARVSLSMGNIRCTAGYRCIDGFRAYRSWAAGYLDWYRLISWYIAVLHKSTIPQIVPTYAPPVENNTNGYIRAIENAVTTWRLEEA